MPVGISLKIKAPDASITARQLNNKAIRGLSRANNRANRLIGFAYQANCINTRPIQPIIKTQYPYMSSPEVKNTGRKSDNVKQAKPMNINMFTHNVAMEIVLVLE